MFNKQMDLNIFLEQRGSFIHPSTITDVLEGGTFSASDHFNITFPKLSSLLKKARITTLKVQDKPCFLYCWNTLNGNICGWLCEQEEMPNTQLADEHQLLLSNMGGIKESFGLETSYLTLNKNFLFTSSKCVVGVGNFDVMYREICASQQKIPIKTESLLGFAHDVNGAITFYDLLSKKVVLLAGDNDGVGITLLPNQPEFTFYTIDGVEFFLDYVELLAQIWLDGVLCTSG